MKRIERDLKKLPGVAGVQLTSGNHYRLTLANRRSVFASATPSDTNVIWATRAKIKQQLRSSPR
jgi:hypothetical protein